MDRHARALQRKARRSGALVVSGLLGLFVVGLTAIPAAAAVTCAEGPAGTLVVTMAMNNDATTISVDPASMITVTDGATPLACGGSVSTGVITTIRVDGQNNQTETVTISQAGAEPFPDGLTTSIILNLGDASGDADVLNITGQTLMDTVTIGATGIDLNGNGSTAAEITGLATVETLSVDASAGNDTVAATGGSGTDVGGTYASALTLLGGEGDDTLNGGTGNDTLTGGAGVDTVGYAGASAAVAVNLATTTQQNTGGGGLDTITLVENATGSPFNDALTGDANANVLNGADGNDMLNGGLGDDTLTGAGGTDTALYSQAASAVTVDLSAGTATGGAGSDTLATIEDVTGSAFGDTLTGDASANALDGRGGDDAIDGGLGDDTLTGGLGSDTVRFEAATAAVVVDLSLGTATGGSGSDTLSGIERVSGTGFDDTLTGDGTTNNLNGRDGNDTIRGADGDDVLKGAAGDDSIRGSAGDDSLQGSAGDDTLKGGTGNDALRGGKGTDACRGGPGSDSITGCED